MASFDDLRDRASQHPVISPLPRLASFYLDDVSIYKSINAFHRDLYDPEYRFEKDVIISEETHHSDYLRLHCTATPIGPRLNEVVDWTNQEHHHKLRRELLHQSGIKEYILDSLTAEELVVLIIVDGLSYHDAEALDLPMQPVFVDGITTTEPGFRRVIYGNNAQSIYSALVNKKGFYQPYGFTYWSRGQEDLSTELHSAMGNNVYRIRDFNKAVDTLRSDGPFNKKTYVQITRMGFDQDSHNRKEEPNHEAVRDAIVSDLREIKSVANEVADKYRIFATADHGILWRSQLPEKPPVVVDELAHHPRFVEGRIDVPYGLTLQSSVGDLTTGLGYPALARELKHTEWGVHGGFSYYESIVPLIEITESDSI
jgi:hypothetical protein